MGSNYDRMSGHRGPGMIRQLQLMQQKLNAHDLIKNRPGLLEEMALPPLDNGMGDRLTADRGPHQVAPAPMAPPAENPLKLRSVLKRE
jgi:hypothetical protein